MREKKEKYIYIVLLAVFASALLYSAYALIVDGSPTLKSLREHVKSANAYHKDSLYDKAIEPYRRAMDMDPESSLANYNSATNLLLKNYKDNKDGVSEPEIVKDVFDNALVQLETAASNETKYNKVAEIRHNQALVYHLNDTLEAAAEKYKESLRKNPADNETRYNLAVVLYQLKNRHNEQQNQDQQQQQNQDQQQQQNQDQQQQQNQDQQQQQNQDQQQQQNQDQQQQQMSEEELTKENAERLLEAVMQDEKGVLEKVKRERNRTQKQKLQKNW